MTSHDITERVILIKLVYAVVYHGVADREAYSPVLNQLQGAIDDELAGASRFQRPTVTRHAKSAVESILRPYRNGDEHCAKVGLAVFHTISDLIEAGMYVPDNPVFMEMLNIVTSEDGTITEFAKAEKINRSAQKQARRLLIAMQSLGYFVGADDAVAA